MFLLEKNYSNIFNKNLIALFKILINKGDEARLVGGCVRNYILNKEINDYDIATIYTPNELEQILTKNNIAFLTVGKKFGTITALYRGEKYEITTLRKDIKTDGRHAIVEFTRDYKEDAKRRDFAFNAMYIDFNGKLYDYFNGLEDLINNNISFIGDAQKRIDEDNLRILRFFRFYGSYCFSSNYNDLSICKKNKNKIKNLSLERISDEIHKAMLSDSFLDILTIMQNNDILQDIFKTYINFNNLELFFYIRKNLNFHYNHLFIIALILSNNKINYELLLTKKEKKYINTILQNIPKIINKFEIKKLLFNLKDKLLVKNIIIIYFCNNYKNFKIIEKNLKLVDKLNIPALEINGDDLKNNNFNINKYEYKKLLEQAKNIFVSSNFKIKKEKIIKKLLKVNNKKEHK